MDFAKHVATLMAGSAGAMAVSLLAAPIIGRLFTPADYGVAAFFVTLCMLIGSLAPLNYERTILLPKNNEDSFLLISLSLRLLSAISFLILVCVGIVWILGFPLPFGGTLGARAWFLPAGIWLVGMGSIVNSALTRAKEFHTISYTVFGHSTLTTGSRIAAGAIWGSSISGLIGGFLLGYGAYLPLIKRRSRVLLRLISPRQSLRRLKNIATEYKDFPLYSMPATFAMRLSSRLPILVIGAIYAPEVLGFYAMADRLIRSPIMSAGQAIRNVYLQRTASLRSRGASLRAPFVKTTIGLTLLGLIPFGALAFFGTDLLRILLGERWIPAGQYVEVLAPWYYAVWVGSTSQSTMTVLRKQSLWLRLQVCVLVIRIAVFAVSYLMEATPLVILTAFATANVLMAAGILAISSWLVWNMKNE